MKDEYISVARNTLLIGNCPQDVADEILDRATVRSWDRGERIFAAGDDAQTIYIVLEGWVKLFRMTASGAEAVVGVFTREQSIGDAAALRADVYPVSAEAVTSCHLMQISASHIIDIMLRRPEACLAILSSTLVHLRSLVNQVESLKTRNAPQRVAQFLITLTAGETSGPCEVELPHDKVLIAGRLGMNPESLSRAFGRLKSHGVTVTGNAVRIADLSELIAFAEVDLP